MDVLLLGMAKTITAGASRIYRSLALSSNDLAESYAKAREYNGVAISAACPLLAHSGHHAVEFQCLLLGVKRTSLFALQMSAFDPKRTWRLVAW